MNELLKINHSLGKENEQLRKELTIAKQGLKAIISEGSDNLRIASKTLTAMEEEEIPQEESENE